MTRISSKEYTKLAEIYDDVMRDVDYRLWADFIDALMLQHHPDPKKILELACGTGSVSYELLNIVDFNITGTDKSPAMIKRAREKKEPDQNIRFEVMDFLDVQLDQKFDIVFSVFDSINYLLEPSQVSQFLKQSKKLLRPNSLLIFDFTTPKNSVESIDYLDNEEGMTGDGYHFLRKSHYDTESQIHTNDFKIKKLADDGETVLETYQEKHQQRAYPLQKMLDIIGKSAYNIVAKYGGFEFKEANEQSLRITMVLQCPNTP